MKIISRICCLFGFHTWGVWRYHVYSPGAYDQTLWKTRTCNCCPKIQEDFMSDPEVVYLNEFLAGKRKCMP